MNPEIKEITMSKEKTYTGRIGLGVIIFLIFMVLKLAGIGEVANWSWWWVTSPLWIPALIGVVIFGVIGIIAFIAFIIKNN
jgi:hypothetical protein